MSLQKEFLQRQKKTPSLMTFIDTHAHLYSSDFSEDETAIIQRAIEANINKILLPNVDAKSVKSVIELAERYPSLCVPMMGLHPTNVTTDYKKELAEIKKHIDPKTTIAIGEIGLDLYWDKSLLAEQQAAFKIQIEWALEYNLPIAIHARDAFDEVFEILDQYPTNQLSGVFHCFTGDKVHAQKILSYKTFKLGIGGVVTFKKSHLPLVLCEIPIEYIVLETDSPYLAPTPYRGKRNEPAYLIEIADKLAEIYNLSTSEIASTTTQNAIKLFNL